MRLAAPSRSRNWSRVSHWRRRTTASSIMAMWTAGPPKEVSPSRKYSNATCRTSPRSGRVAGSAAFEAPCIETDCTLRRMLDFCREMLSDGISEGGEMATTEHVSRKPVTIDRLVSELHRFQASDFDDTPHTICNFLRDLPVEPSSLQPYLTWDAQHYTRN